MKRKTKFVYYTCRISDTIETWSLCTRAFFPMEYKCSSMYRPTWRLSGELARCSVMYMCLLFFFHGMDARSSTYVTTRTKPGVCCTVHVYPLEYKMWFCAQTTRVRWNNKDVVSGTQEIDWRIVVNGTYICRTKCYYDVLVTVECVYYFIIIIILIIDIVFDSVICVIDSVVTIFTKKYRKLINIFYLWSSPSGYVQVLNKDVDIHLLQAKVCCWYIGNSGVTVHKARNILLTFIFSPCVFTNFTYLTNSCTIYL